MKNINYKYHSNNSDFYNFLKKDYYDDLYLENYTYPVNIYFTVPGTGSMAST